MKKYTKFLTIFGTVALVACSSMEVDPEEIATENFPSDFTVAEYIELHPGLYSYQIQDSVKVFNASWTDKALIKKDTAEWFDTSDDAALENLHKIFVDPMLCGYTEDDWTDSWLPDTTITSTETKVYDTVAVKFEKDTVYFPTAIIFDGKKIVGAEGYADSSKTDALVCDADLCGAVVKQKPCVVDSTSKDPIVKTDTVITSGSLSPDQKKRLVQFHFYGEKGEYEKLKAIAPDSVAISSQYVMYGKKSGWPYRKCLDSELENPEILSITEVKLGTTYCYDNGSVREIK